MFSIGQEHDKMVTDSRMAVRNSGDGETKREGHESPPLPTAASSAGPVPLCGRPAAFPRWRALDAGGEMEWRVGGRLSPGPGERFVAGRVMDSLEM